MARVPAGAHTPPLSPCLARAWRRGRSLSCCQPGVCPIVALCYAEVRRPLDEPAAGRQAVRRRPRRPGRGTRKSEPVHACRGSTTSTSPGVGIRIPAGGSPLSQTDKMPALLHGPAFMLGGRAVVRASQSKPASRQNPLRRAARAAPQRCVAAANAEGSRGGKDAPRESALVNELLKESGKLEGLEWTAELLPGADSASMLRRDPRRDSKQNSSELTPETLGQPLPSFPSKRRQGGLLRVLSAARRRAFVVALHAACSLNLLSAAAWCFPSAQAHCVDKGDSSCGPGRARGDLPSAGVQREKGGPPPQHPAAARGGACWRG